MKALSESVTIFEEIYKQDAADALNKKEYAASLFYTGVAYDMSNQPKDALVQFERSRVLRKELAESTSTTSTKVDLMLTHSQLGNVDETTKLIEELSKIQGKNHDLWLDIARSYTQLYRRADDSAKEGYRDEALKALERVVSDGLQHAFPVTTEPDLAMIRTEDRYKGVVSQLTERQMANR
jgi:tetratricopeptide (TPR) repeat protein